MEREKLRTTFNITIDEDNIEKWEGLSKRGIIISDLVNDYLRNEITSLKDVLDEVTLEKFKKDELRDFIIKKLIISYYNDNILFLDDYMKMVKISNHLNLSSKLAPISINDKKTNISSDKREFEEDEIYDNESINNIDENISSDNKDEFNDEVSMDKEVVEEDETTYVEDSKENEVKEEKEEEEKDEPLARKYNNANRQRLFGKK